ncbi:MAG: NADH-quinone oxidoreductase subunit N [Polyangiaceae bacterium]|nr:NADH-quinone oxidoreductase subunit N [Polyangiaceae bacterium]
MSVLFALSPLVAVALGAVLLMLADAFGKPVVGEGKAGELGLLSAVIFIASAVACIAVWLVGPEHIEATKALAPHLVIDRFSIFVCFVLSLGAGLAALFGAGYLPEHRMDRGEFFPLLLWSTLGAMALAAAGDLITLFIALETMSLGVYCMVGLRRTPRALEAALKYFLLGSFAAALLLFGSALLYGVTGHTDFTGIGTAIANVGTKGSEVGIVPLSLGLLLTLAGLAFKVSAVPFHMWTPDAYEGAPTPTTSYMAVVVKAAAVAVLVRVLAVVFADERLSSWGGTGWPMIVATLAVLTMTVGNLVAGRQESVKRMLAYSSIAHAGYVLIGVVAIPATPSGTASVLFYLLGYAVSTAGAFGALILCGRGGAETTSYDDFDGFGRRHPAAALVFSLFLLSLAGIPPTAGFFAKLYVFRAAIEAEMYVLAVVGLVNSVVAAYYYVKVLVAMYMREPAPGAATAEPMRSGMVVAALLVAAALVLLIGIFPGSWLEMAALAKVR